MYIVCLCVGKSRWGSRPALVSWSSGRWGSLGVRLSSSSRSAPAGGLRLYRWGSLCVGMVAQLPSLLPETVQGESHLQHMRFNSLLWNSFLFLIFSVFCVCRYSEIVWACVVCWVSRPRPLCLQRWTSPVTWTSVIGTGSPCAPLLSLTTSSCPCPWIETKIRCAHTQTHKCFSHLAGALSFDLCCCTGSGVSAQGGAFRFSRFCHRVLHQTRGDVSHRRAPAHLHAGCDAERILQTCTWRWREPCGQEEESSG